MKTFNQFLNERFTHPDLKGKRERHAMAVKRLVVRQQKNNARTLNAIKHSPKNDDLKDWHKKYSYKLYAPKPKNKVKDRAKEAYDKLPKNKIFNVPVNDKWYPHGIKTNIKGVKTRHGGEYIPIEYKSKDFKSLKGGRLREGYNPKKDDKSKWKPWKPSANFNYKNAVVIAQKEIKKHNGIIDGEVKRGIAKLKNLQTHYIKKTLPNHITTMDGLKHQILALTGNVIDHANNDYEYGKHTTSTGTFTSLQKKSARRREDFEREQKEKRDYYKKHYGIGLRERDEFKEASTKEDIITSSNPKDRYVVTSRNPHHGYKRGQNHGTFASISKDKVKWTKDGLITNGKYYASPPSSTSGSWVHVKNGHFMRNSRGIGFDDHHMSLSNQTYGRNAWERKDTDNKGRLLKRK